MSGVLLGSIFGNALMYVFAKQINKYISPGNMWFKIAGVVILIGLVILVELRYQRIKKKYFQKQNGDENSDASAEA